MHFTTVRRNER